MKKNLFYYLFTVICSVTLFASCSDDDEKSGKSCASDNFLLVKTVCNLHIMVRRCWVKKVTFTPDATNAQKGNSRLKGNLT